MNDALALRIRSTLESLRATPGARSIFGAESHGFALAPAIGNADVAAFEGRHGITLPPDYRWFLTQVGNGGAGPYYGIFPLGHIDGVRRATEPWSDDEGIVGVLSRPFPLSEPWNDLTGMPSAELLAEDEDAYGHALDAFYSRYGSADHVAGAIPACHEGCNLRIWLVVTGPERGNLWRDLRADQGGLLPLEGPDGARVSFLSWYEGWLDEAVGQMTSRA